MIYKLKVEELDLPEDPCNPDPEYSFYTCLQKNTVKMVLLKDYYISQHFTRLDVEPSGATGVTRAHPFVVMANSTGGIFGTFLLVAEPDLWIGYFSHSCFFQNDGRLVRGNRDRSLLRMTFIIILRTDRSLFPALDSRLHFPPLLWVPFLWPSGGQVVSEEMARYKG